MIIQILVFVITLIIQIMLALYSKIVHFNIDKKYRYSLVSNIEPAQTLEKYAKIYQPINLRVNAHIQQPAQAEDEYVLINRNKMYIPDLFTNFYTLFQVELAKKQHAFVRNIHTPLFILFTLQICTIIVALLPQSTLQEYFLYAAFFFQFCVILVSFFAMIRMRMLLETTLTVATDLLDLFQEEYDWAEQLRDDLQYKVFEYPFEFVKKFVLFFVPSR